MSFYNYIIIHNISTWYTLTLVQAFCEGIHVSQKNKFSSFLTLYKVPHTPRHLEFVKHNNIHFLWRFLSEHQKIHEEFVTHFVEFTGIWHAKQMVILSDKVWKMIHYMHWYLHFFKSFLFICFANIYTPFILKLCQQE